MPRPSVTLTTQRPDLADAFQEYPILAQQNGYVGLDLLPELNVPSQAGAYGVVPLEQVKKLATDANLSRNVTGGYTKMDFKFETTSYSTVEYGIEVPVDDREAAMYSQYLSSDQVAADLAQITVLDAMEKRIINAVIAADGSPGSISTAWTTAATAVPVSDIGNAMKTVYDNTGLRPNTVCMAWKDFWNMTLTAQFQDYYKHTSNSAPGVFNTQAIAAALGVQKVLVSGVSTNTAAEDAAASMSQAWPVGKIWVGITASPNASHREVCIGRTHHWGADGSRVTGMAEEYYDDSLRKTFIRVRHDVHSKILYAAAGRVLTGASS